MRSAPLILVFALLALGLALRGSIQAVSAGEHQPHLVVAIIAAAIVVGYLL